jgi:hypothetical protein
LAASTPASRKAAAKKAWKTRKRKTAAKKAWKTRKYRAAGTKPLQRVSGERRQEKAWATRKAKAVWGGKAL